MNADDAKRATARAKGRVERATDRAVDTVEDGHEQLAERLRPLAHHPALQGIARVGFIVTGLVYALIGWTAIRVVLGVAGADSADQQGALKVLELVPGGVVLLAACAIALIALAVWFVIEGIAGSGSVSGRRETIAYLGKHVGKAIVYAALGITTLEVLFDTETDSEEVADEASSTLVQSGWGTALLLVAAAVIIGVGIAFVVIGIRRKFVEQLDLSSAGRFRGAVVALSVVGYFARGIAFMLIGVTFAVAALNRDPGQAGLMDSALKGLLGVPLGAPLLIVIGIGLIIAGLATMLRAKFQSM